MASREAEALIQKYGGGWAADRANAEQIRQDAKAAGTWGVQQNSTLAFTPPKVVVPEEKKTSADKMWDRNSQTQKISETTRAKANYNTAKKQYDDYVNSAEYRQRLAENDQKARQQEVVNWFLPPEQRQAPKVIQDDREMYLRAAMEQAEAEYNRAEDAKVVASDLEAITGLSDAERRELEQYAAGRDVDYFNTLNFAQNGIQIGNAEQQAAGLIAKYGQKRVDEMANTLSRQNNAELTRQAAEKGAQHAGTGFWSGLGSSLLSVPVNAVGGIMGTLDYIKGLSRKDSRYKTLDPNAMGNIGGVYAGAIRGQVGQNISGDVYDENGNQVQDGGKFRGALVLGYQGIMSAADSVARAYIGGAAGGATLAALGSFSQTMADASARGATPQQAALLATTVAGIEALSEKIPLDNLIRTAKGGKQTLVKAIGTALAQAGIEATTEEISLLGSVLAEAAILQEKSSYQQSITGKILTGTPPEEAKLMAIREILDEAVNTALVSMISGGVSSLTGSAFAAIQERNNQAPKLNTPEAIKQQTLEAAQQAKYNDKRIEDYNNDRKTRPDVIDHAITAAWYAEMGSDDGSSRYSQKDIDAIMNDPAAVKWLRDRNIDTSDIEKALDAVRYERYNLPGSFTPSEQQTEPAATVAENGTADKTEAVATQPTAPEVQPQAAQTAPVAQETPVQQVQETVEEEIAPIAETLDTETLEEVIETLEEEIATEAPTAEPDGRTEQQRAFLDTLTRLLQQRTAEEQATAQPTQTEQQAEVQPDEDIFTMEETPAETAAETPVEDEKKKKQQAFLNALNQIMQKKGAEAQTAEPAAVETPDAQAAEPVDNRTEQQKAFLDILTQVMQKKGAEAQQTAPAAEVKPETAPVTQTAPEPVDEPAPKQEEAPKENEKVVAAQRKVDDARGRLQEVESQMRAKDDTRKQLDKKETELKKAIHERLIEKGFPSFYGNIPRKDKLLQIYEDANNTDDPRYKNGSYRTMKAIENWYGGIKEDEYMKKDKDLARALFQMARDPQKFGAQPVPYEMWIKVTGEELNRVRPEWKIPIGNNKFILFAEDRAGRSYTRMYNNVVPYVVDENYNRLHWSVGRIESFQEIVKDIKRNTGMTVEEWLSLPVTQQALQEYNRQKPLDEDAGRAVEMLRGNHSVTDLIDAVGDLLTQYEANEQAKQTFAQENFQEFSNLQSQRKALQQEVTAAEQELTAAQQQAEEEAQKAQVRQAIADGMKAVGAQKAQKNTAPEVAKAPEVPQEPKIKGTGAAEANFTGTAAYDNLLSDDNVQRARTGDVREVEVPKTDAQGRQVSEFVGNVMNSGWTPDVFTDTIKKMVMEGKTSHDIMSNESALNDAAKAIQDEGGAYNSLQNIKEKAEEGLTGPKVVAQAELIYHYYANEVARMEAEGGADETTKAIAADSFVTLAKLATNSGQATQLFSVFRRMTPDGQVMTIKKNVQSYIDEVNKGRSNKKKVTATVNDTLVDNYLKADTDEAKAEAMDEIYKDVATQIKPTLGEAWDAWRNLAMLFNAKTHIRNFASTGAFKPYTIIKRNIAAAMETVFVDKENRTRSMLGIGKKSVDLLKWAKADAKSDRTLEAFANYGKGGNEAARKIQEERQLLFAPLDKVASFNMAMMEKEDLVWKRNEYAASLASFLKARGYTAEQASKGLIPDSVMNEARQLAILDAMKATFNDRNRFSDFISKFRFHGKDPLSKTANALAKGVLPYAKTPANIVVRVKEYSPVEIARGFHTLAAKVKTGDATIAQGIDQIASGLTGTGMMILGAALAEGLIPGVKLVGRVKDEDEKREGAQDYSIKIGDTYYGIGWIAPASIPLLIGAELGEAFPTWGDFKEASIWEKANAIASIGSATINPMLELSVLSSLNSIADSYSSAETTGEGLLNAFITATTSYFTQGLPTMLGQFEQASEAEKTTTYVNTDNNLEKSLKKIAANASQRIPGVDLYRTTKLDEWGQPILNEGTQDQRINNAFFNPFSVSKVKTSDLSQEITRLNKAQETAVSPPYFSKVISYTDKDGNYHDKYRLTEEEYQTIAQTQGQTAKRILETMINSSNYKAMSDEEKAKAFTMVYSYAREKAMSEGIQGHKGYSESWMMGLKKGNEADEILRRVTNSELNRTFTNLDTAWDSGYSKEVTERYSNELAAAYESYSKMDADQKKEVKQFVSGNAAKYIEAREKGISHEVFIKAAKNVNDVKGTGKGGTVRDIDRRKAIAKTSGLTESQIDKLMKVYMPDYDKTDESPETTEFKYQYIREELDLSPREYASTYEAYLDGDKKVGKIADIMALGYDWTTANALYKVYSGSMKNKLLSLYG